MWIMASNYTDWEENACDEFSNRQIYSVYSNKEAAIKGFWSYILKNYVLDLRASLNWKSFKFYEHRGKYRIAYDRENDILYGGRTNVEDITFICEVEDGEDLRNMTTWGLQIWPDDYDNWKKYNKPTDMESWEQYWLNEEDY